VEKEERHNYIKARQIVKGTFSRRASVSPRSPPYISRPTWGGGGAVRVFRQGKHPSVAQGKGRENTRRRRGADALTKAKRKKLS